MSGLTVLIELSTSSSESSTSSTTSSAAIAILWVMADDVSVNSYPALEIKRLNDLTSILSTIEATSSVWTIFTSRSTIRSGLDTSSALIILSTSRSTASSVTPSSSRLIGRRWGLCGSSTSLDGL
jgi:hypothetical protein